MKVHKITIVVANISCSKNESKSQLIPVPSSTCQWLLQISVVQRMKANHNAITAVIRSQFVVANISCSKNESKSQLTSRSLLVKIGCCKYQLFKEWKQITTSSLMSSGSKLLLQISVVQRMKANHNGSGDASGSAFVVANISCSKNESKSQLSPMRACSYNGCCKYQLFKEWKQITTIKFPTLSFFGLLQISVVQRMKANHNHPLPINACIVVVANISCSKNESKSQRSYVPPCNMTCCCKYQLFKEWKQITTPVPVIPSMNELLQISVVQRMKANHNDMVATQQLINVVANISCSKNESKSQQLNCYYKRMKSCCKYQLFKEWKQITTNILAFWTILRLLQISVVQRMKANHNHSTKV